MLSYLESLFGVVRVDMPPVKSIVELLEIEQILVCQAERAHPVVLADITEKHHEWSLSHMFGWLPANLVHL